MSDYCEIPGAPLGDWTTFRLGGPCRRLLDCPTPEAVIAAVRALADAREPFRLMGGGSNLLVADAGLGETVVRFVEPEPRITCDDGLIVAGGGTALDELARWCVENGWAGLTFASGIPGTVGGGLVGNAGAFGEQLADRLESVTWLAADGTVVERPRAAIRFSYRASTLEDERGVALAARWRLPSGDRYALRAERETRRTFRRARHPDWRVTPCAGSFFRNVEPTSRAGPRQAAGWFLEKAGARSMTEGGAAVFPGHANIIIRARPDGTARDVARLARRMADAVREKFGLTLRPEVRYWGAVES